MEIRTSVPARYDKPGKCKWCGKGLPLLQRFSRSSERQIHKTCYEEIVFERQQAVEQYGRALRSAILDGTLTTVEKDSLTQLANQLRIPESVQRQMNLGVYRGIHEERTASGTIDKEGEEHLRKVQSDLDIRDEEIIPQLSQLTRLRLIHEIGEGKLPVVNSQLILKKGEVCHLECSAGFSEERVTSRGYVGGSQGVSVRIMRGVYYRVGAHKGEFVSTKGIVPIDSGTLAITNKRIIFNGYSKTFSIPLTKLVNYVVYEDAIQLDKEGKSKPGYFTVDDPELLATIISALAQNI
jgi:hypothetical protein